MHAYLYLGNTLRTSSKVRGRDRGDVDISDERLRIGRGDEVMGDLGDGWNGHGVFHSRGDVHTGGEHSVVRVPDQMERPDTWLPCAID